MSSTTNVTAMLQSALWVKSTTQQDGTTRDSAQQRLLRASDMPDRTTWVKYMGAIAAYAATLSAYHAATANDDAPDISNRSLVTGLQSIYDVLALVGVRKDSKPYRANNYHVRYILRHATAHDKRIIDGQAHKGEKLVSLTALRTCIEYCLHLAINNLPMPIAASTSKQASQIDNALERTEKIVKAEREAAEKAAIAKAAAKAAAQVEANAKAAEKAATKSQDKKSA